MRAAPLQRALASAVQTLLRPVVRRLVAWGVPYPALDQIVRELYVEVAERDFALPFKKSTDSRITLLTGLHRKEVARLRQLDRSRPAATRLEMSAAARVIGRWLAPPYADGRGRPLVLPYEGATARAKSFARIVHDLAVDVPPRSVLDELVRLGAVALDAGGHVTLHAEALVPRGNVEAMVELLGIDPGELFATIAHNIEASDDPWLQRKVVYDNVGSDALASLRRAASELGAEFLRRANALLAGVDRDRNPDAPGGDRARVTLGAYYFEDVLDAKREGTARDAGAVRRNPPRRAPAARGSSSHTRRR